MLIQTDENSYRDSIIKNKILLDLKNNSNIEDAFNIYITNIQKYFKSFNKVFIIAGLGGICGSKVLGYLGATCMKYDCISHAVVTIPFHYEGKLRSKVANETIDKSKKNFSHFKIFENQSIYAKANKDTTFIQAFDILNESIYEYVRNT